MTVELILPLFWGFIVATGIRRPVDIDVQNLCVVPILKNN